MELPPPSTPLPPPQTPSQSLPPTLPSTSSSFPPSSSQPPPPHTHTIAIGEMVETARRAWPGINQPGGLAKITKLNHSSSNLLTSVDVFYPVERRSESHVEMQWITVRSNFMENAVKHGGSARGAKGRCSRCGSLRRDCGECDWKFEEEQR